MLICVCEACVRGGGLSNKRVVVDAGTFPSRPLSVSQCVTCLFNK